MKYICECCGTEYDKIPLYFGSSFPDYYFSVPPNERGQRIELEDSLCVVDQSHFFHRGFLTIPITDYPEDLVFSVWTSISEDNFGLRMDLWENPKRVDQDPYFGWLQTDIPTYVDTLNIKTKAYECEVGLIPDIFVYEEDHQLTIDQRDGITFKQASEIVKEILRIDHKKE